MKIELGKKYKTRGGWMAEVVSAGSRDGWYADHGKNHFGNWWHEDDGSYGGDMRDYDLIAPWEDEAVDHVAIAHEIVELGKKNKAIKQDLDKAEIRRQYACAALTGLLARTLTPNDAIRSAKAIMEIADAMMKAEEE